MLKRYRATATMLPGETDTALMNLLERLGATEVKKLPDEEGTFTKGFISAIIDAKIAKHLRREYGVETFEVK